jgi:transposase-like protein
VRRIFTAEQKFEILKDIERCQTIKEGLAKHQLADSVYYKWKRQLEVGVRASLRAYSEPNRPPIPTQIGHLFRSKPARVTEQIGHPLGDRLN